MRCIDFSRTSFEVSIDYCKKSFFLFTKFSVRNKDGLERFTIRFACCSRILVYKDKSLLYYRLATKLREGNVFSRDCPFTGGPRPHVTITHDALNLTVQGSPFGPVLLPTKLWEGNVLSKSYRKRGRLYVGVNHS